MTGEPAWMRAIKSARQQVAGILRRDRIADAGSISTQAETGGEQSRSDVRTGLNDLPLEIRQMVVENLHDLRDLNNFRKVSRGTHDVVESLPAAANFYAAVREGGRLAEDLHERTYPKKGLPEVPPDYSHPNEQAGLPVSADEYIGALGPTLRYLSATHRSNIVKDVHRLSNRDAKAASIANIAKHGADLKLKDVSDLTDDALKIFGTKKRVHDQTPFAAARAIVRLNDRHELNRPMLKKLTKLINKDPILENVFDTVQSDHWDAAAPIDAARGNAVGPVGRQTKRVMEQLREKFEGALNDTTISAQQRMKTVGSVATSIPEEINTRRAELLNRLREPPGRG